MAPLLPSTDAPRGQVTGHLLMLAELHGLDCSGPMVGTEHSYALTDEVLGRGAESFDADDATRELVRRFFEGHGPASARDLARWCTLTVTQITSVVGDLGLNTVQVDGTQLWYSADVVEQAMANADRARRSAFLLPTFDEVLSFLSYLVPNFSRSCAHPSAEAKTQFNVAGGGLVVVDGTDVGGWKRTLTREGPASVLNSIPGWTIRLADWCRPRPTGSSTSPLIEFDSVGYCSVGTIAHARTGMPLASAMRGAATKRIAPVAGS
ncbi:MAG: crosslink repair DNA glycosylase YcaQ family protein [Pirellulales bacterium]